MWKSRLNLALFPELASIKEVDERNAALYRAMASAPLGKSLAAVAVAMLALAPVHFVLFNSFVRDGGAWWFLAAIPLGLSWAFVGTAILSLFLRRHIRASLRVQLNSLGKPTCLTCGYNLTGNTSGVCPECGEPK